MQKANTEIKTREDTIKKIAVAMENMYHKCENDKKQDFTETYFQKLEKEKTYIQECFDTIAQIGTGNEQRILYTRMCHLYDTYEDLYENAKLQKNGNILKFKKSNQQISAKENLIQEQIQHYHNYMFCVKELLQKTLEKIELLEEPYKIATKKIHTLTGKLYDAFYRELNTAKINHLAMIKNNLERREKELITFETWSEEDKIARLSEANKRFYEITQKHASVINKRAESIAKQSIVKNSNKQNNMNNDKNNFDVNYAEIYFKTHPTQRFKMRPIIPISIEHFNFVEKMQENTIDFKSGLVQIFQGKDAKLRYMYERKQKPKIEAVLRGSVEHLYKTYEKAIKSRIEELKLHCESIRDASLAEELGTINDIIKAKKKIQTLLEHNTDFLYEEKGFMDILFY